jgi:hypothetical protein
MCKSGLSAANLYNLPPHELLSILQFSDLVINQIEKPNNISVYRNWCLENGDSEVH